MAGNVSIEGAVECLLLLVKIEHGLQRADVDQRTVPSEAREKMLKWLE